MASSDESAFTFICVWKVLVFIVLVSVRGGVNASDTAGACASKISVEISVEAIIVDSISKIAIENTPTRELHSLRPAVLLWPNCTVKLSVDVDGRNKDEG
mmetsp:Transcript_54111/g.114955  ORF Transcript_54111/g.114955 Transcript_54111/m.114955 type:complete len:100 (-) Transcript_54111:55-354(-)